ncbi:hypothetical protein [Rhizobium sp.]|uniref:hypothetical protein n=1 Tax=Rhizobium sp. TaxID=391 RepID=UPI0034C65D72
MAPLFSLLDSGYVIIPLPHRLDIDMSVNPFLQQSKEGGIRVDRHTARCCPIDRTLRDGSPSFGICAHAASRGIDDGWQDLTVGNLDGDLKLLLVDNM